MDIYNNNDLWKQLMHWELLMAVKAREDRIERQVTKIQALVRGGMVRWNQQMEISGLGGLEDLALGNLSNDQVAALYDWHPFSWDWFVKERQAMTDMGMLHGDITEEQMDEVMADITNNHWDDWSYSISDDEQPHVITLGDWMGPDFGTEFSSDNAGDGPFGALLVVLILILDKLNSQRGRNGQWRAKDQSLALMAEEYPWTFWLVCTIIRHKISRNYYFKAGQQLGKAFSSNNAGDGPGDEFELPELIWSAEEQVLFWIGLAEVLTIEQTCALVPKTRNAILNAYSRLVTKGKVVRIGRGEYMFGPAYSSDNAGDGPITEEERVELATLDATLFMARYELVVEAFDLQVWTYGMRIYEHEYLGMTFDHHRDFGSVQMMRDLDALRQLFEIWLRSEDHDFISLPKWLWSKCIDHLETLEMAEFFHDDRMEESLRDLIRDMILLRADPNHFLIPRPESSKHNFVPLF